MVKKILLLGGTVIALVAGVLLFAAFESHLVNISAQVSKAMDVPVKGINMGNVFPQEQIDSACTVTEVDASPSDGLAENDDIISGNCVQVRMSTAFKDCAHRKPGEPCPGGFNYALKWEAKPATATYKGTTKPIDFDICPWMQILDSDPVDGNDGTAPPTWCDKNGDGTPDNLGTTKATGSLTRLTATTILDHYDLWDLIFFAPVCAENFNPETTPPGPFPAGMSHKIPAGECKDTDTPADGQVDTANLSSDLKIQITLFK